MLFLNVKIILTFGAKMFIKNLPLTTLKFVFRNTIKNTATDTNIRPY